MADLCLTCGDEHRHHSGLANMIDCDIPGCPCTKFEPADPTVEQTSDLHQAIQAAAIALSIHSIQDPIADWTTMATVAVEAAEPILLQATRDRHAALEVHAAELRDLLEQMVTEHLFDQEASIDWDWLHEMKLKVLATLQTDGPARGHTILQEVQRLREENRQLRIAYDQAAAPPGAALDALDQAAQREDDR